VQYSLLFRFSAYNPGTNLPGLKQHVKTRLRKVLTGCTVLSGENEGDNETVQGKGFREDENQDNTCMHAKTGKREGKDSASNDS